MPCTSAQVRQDEEVEEDPSQPQASQRVQASQQTIVSHSRQFSSSL
jgi:hypothetical protein